jgi:hypothetical protein
MMASTTNRKAKVEPVTVVEKDQLERKAEAAAAALSVDEKPVDAIRAAGGDKAPPAAREGRLTPLPKEEVERVLSWKRGKLTSIYSTAEAIEVFEALSDSCAEYQAWMRAEYEANGGVVLVDDEFLREQAESQQSLKDFWEEEVGDDDDFDFTGWHFEGDVDSPGWNIPRPASSEEHVEGEVGEKAVVHQELNIN